MIAAVATLRDGRIGNSFEIRTGHIVKQQIVLEIKKFSQAPNQMLLDRFLLREQPVQGSIISAPHRSPRYQFPTDLPEPSSDTTAPLRATHSMAHTIPQSLKLQSPLPPTLSPAPPASVPLTPAPV